MLDALLPLGLAAYVLAWPLAWIDRRRLSARVLLFLTAAVALTAAAIAERWLSSGYGPFLTLHEVLLSNVFSLGLVALLAYVFVPASRRGLPYLLPVVLLVGGWALTEPADTGELPATFASPWLWLHVGFGKVFLGALLVALGMAAAGLAEQLGPELAALNAAVWRFAAIAFVFDSAMLLTGAIWANDAWGRYWNWDPVETWALATWLTLGLCLHVRLTWRLPLRAGWLMICGVFVLAFLTLFGMPFLSLGPHKGIL